MRSHWRFLPLRRVRTRDHAPRSLSPCSVKRRCPLARAWAGDSDELHVPRSQISTLPAPYSPWGISPSKRPYASGWSSTSTASRLLRGSRGGSLRDGPAAQRIPDLKAEVEMPRACMVQLNNETRSAPRAGATAAPATGFGRRREVALVAILGESSRTAHGSPFTRPLTERRTPRFAANIIGRCRRHTHGDLSQRIAERGSASDPRSNVGKTRGLSMVCGPRGRRLRSLRPRRYVGQEWSAIHSLAQRSHRRGRTRCYLLQPFERQCRV